MDTGQLADKLVLWIKDTVLAAGFKGAVIGMSGGIDSSVVAVLCHRAFPQDTLGVMIPCGSQAEDKAHAQAVADKFSIPAVEVALDNIYTSLLEVLPSYKVDATLSHLAQANLKVRSRMLTLYYIANQLQYIVVGSSNKSELSVGYFTKYGDGGVDIIPLGNLVKGEVRKMARFLGIPQPIIDKPPSAGLWKGQTDEKEMGISYDELDRYLLTGDVSSEVRGKIESMIANSGHKRALPPIPHL
ncbi:MAG: NAD(+) synthase [Dehalococcoidales bacterium]